MSRFLFAPFPVTGHVNPGLPIARELVERGHDVRWYVTPRFQREVESIGATYVPYRKAMQLDEEHFDGLFPDRPKSGMKQMQYDIEHAFINVMPGMLQDLEDELARHPADVIVGDNGSAVCGLVHDRTGMRWGIYGINPLTMPSRDTAPFGLGLMPSSTFLGRLRNRALYWFVDNVVFRSANERNNAVRKQVGVAPFRHRSLFDFPRDSDLYMQGTVPSFEYPRTDMPPHVRFIGASIPQEPLGWTPPSWWGRMDGRRVVLVTQGTINNDFDQLIRPAVRALAEENVLVIVTTGSKAVEEVRIDPLPPNVIVERFVPYARLMPKVDLLLTNGGYGSIQIALAHGVPIVAIGKTEEKPEIVSRVQWSGVGVGLKVLLPSEKQIRRSVREVLTRGRYRRRAARISEEMAVLDAPQRGADLLEELAGTEALAEIA